MHIIWYIYFIWKLCCRIHEKGLDLTKGVWEDRQTSNISHTKSQNLNASRLVLHLSLPNPLKPGVKSRMKIGAVPTGDAPTTS